MEYIEYGDLKGYLKKSERQSEEDVKEIVAQILEGLVILHGRQICYRDLKPENILISSLTPIRIKLADFGISKWAAGTKLKTSVGTDKYLAPEVRGFLPRHLGTSRDYTYSVDLWSLGCLLHEMLTLEVPFLRTGPGQGATELISGVVPPDHDIAEVRVDHSLFIQFCGGGANFPVDALQRFNVSYYGVMLVTSLLKADPQLRPSAIDALASEWFLEPPSLLAEASQSDNRNKQKDEPEILRIQMLNAGLGVSLRTANLLITGNGGLGSSSLLDELFPSLGTKIIDILRRAIMMKHSLLTQLLEQTAHDLDGLFDRLFETAIVVKDWGIIYVLLITGETGKRYSNTVLEIREGLTEKARLLLEGGADTNAKPILEYLQAAARGGHIALAKLLLERGAYINAWPGEVYGLTALQAAAVGGHIEMAKLLLERGADINASPGPVGGLTALQAAVRGGHIEMAKLLLERGADINASPGRVNGLAALQAAALGGHIEMAKLLLERGADINASPGPVGSPTALQAAAVGGHIEMAKLLLERGADINAWPGEVYGITALQAAARYGHIRMAKLLLQYGADVNASPGPVNGLTALQAAVLGGHSEMVNLVLKEDTDINAKPVSNDGLHPPGL